MPLWVLLVQDPSAHVPSLPQPHTVLIATLPILGTFSIHPNPSLIEIFSRTRHWLQMKAKQSPQNSVPDKRICNKV